MAYPEDFSPSSIGVIGATLNNPDHIVAHDNIAQWIAAAEQHVGTEIKSIDPTPELYVGNSGRTGTNFGVYRRLGDLVWFQAIFQPNAIQNMGFETVTFDLPFPMASSNLAAVGTAFIRLRSGANPEYTSGAWRGSPAAGLGNQRGIVYASGSTFDVLEVSGSYYAAAA